VLAADASNDPEYRSGHLAVLSALSACNDVHLFSLGDENDFALDGLPIAFHSTRPRLSERAALRRDLLVANFSKPSAGTEYERADTHDWPSESVDQILHRDTVDAWKGVAPLLAELAPDVVVILDHRDRHVLGALSELPDVPVVLIPLVDTIATPDRVQFDELFLRTTSIVAFTEAERGQIAARTDTPIVVLELPVDEPLPPAQPTEFASSAHVLVLTDAESDDHLQRHPFAHLVALANPTQRVIVASRRAAVFWQNGRRQPQPELATEDDLFALVASASVVVDLHPGRLYARRTLHIQYMGVPTIVPSRSRAREYSEKGNGGLWFCNAGEMLWALDAALDPEIGPALGRQGRAYVAAQHGSSERFAELLALACRPEEGVAAQVS
jgi:hypothetical protein